MRHGRDYGTSRGSRLESADQKAGAELLQARLQHVYWIGGGSGAGKSTVARRVADQHGLNLYSTDDVMPDHASRSKPEDAPYLSEFKTMDMDERWLNRSPEIMLDTFHWFRGEGFDSIVEDLLRLPPSADVIAEGFRLLPQLVKPLLAKSGHAVWLLPTPAFRRAVFNGRRGTASDIPGRSSDPERARHNLLERDRMFTNRILEEARRLQLVVIEIDSASEDEVAEQVTQAFGL